MMYRFYDTNHTSDVNVSKYRFYDLHPTLTVRKYRI